MITGANIDIQFLLWVWKNFSNNEFRTTDTELIAIASQANSGLRTSPNDANAPPAIGIHKIL